MLYPAFSLVGAGGGAADLIAEADRVAKKAADESAAKRDEYQQEAIWWGTYRDSLINQLQLFISSLGDHLSEAQKQARAAASPRSHGVSASAQPSESPSVRQVTLTPGMPVSLGKAPVPPNGEPADQREP